MADPQMSLAYAYSTIHALRREIEFLRDSAMMRSSLPPPQPMGPPPSLYGPPQPMAPQPMAPPASPAECTTGQEGPTTAICNRAPAQMTPRPNVQITDVEQEKAPLTRSKAGPKYTPPMPSKRINVGPGDGQVTKAGSPPKAESSKPLQVPRPSKAVAKPSPEATGPPMAIKKGSTGPFVDEALAKQKSQRAQTLSPKESTKRGNSGNEVGREARTQPDKGRAGHDRQRGSPGNKKSECSHDGHTLHVDAGGGRDQSQKKKRKRRPPRSSRRQCSDVTFFITKAQTTTSPDKKKRKHTKLSSEDDVRASREDHASRKGRTPTASSEDEKVRMTTGPPGKPNHGPVSEDSDEAYSPSSSDSYDSSYSRDLSESVGETDGRNGDTGMAQSSDLEGVDGGQQLADPVGSPGGMSDDSASEAEAVRPNQEKFKQQRQQQMQRKINERNERKLAEMKEKEKKLYKKIEAIRKAHSSEPKKNGRVKSSQTSANNPSSPVAPTGMTASSRDTR